MARDRAGTVALNAPPLSGIAVWAAVLLLALVRNGVTVPLDRPVLATVNEVGAALVPVLRTTTMTEPSVLR